GFSKITLFFNLTLFYLNHYHITMAEFDEFDKYELPSLHQETHRDRQYPYESDPNELYVYESYPDESYQDESYLDNLY
ncbi:25678_t:CDS:1, partial [Dentiscutata erythropus]